MKDKGGISERFEIYVGVPVCTVTMVVYCFLDGVREIVVKMSEYGVWLNHGNIAVSVRKNAIFLNAKKYVDSVQDEDIKNECNK